jgi:hypothetical protein
LRRRASATPTLAYQNQGGFVETGASALYFSYLPQSAAEKSEMVAHTFTSSNPLTSRLRGIDALRRAA